MDKYYKIKDFEMLKADSRVNSFKSKLQVIKQEEAISTRDDRYLKLKFRDISGEKNINIFPERVNIENLKKKFSIGNILDVKINIARLERGTFFNIKDEDYNYNVLTSDDFNLEDFFEFKTIDKNPLINELNQTISKIKDSDFIALLEEIFADIELKNKYYEWPSSKKLHHSYTSGNLQHTIGMIKILHQLVSLYDEDTLLNTDLIYTGIILHDIGKIKEYDFNNGIIIYGDESGLGHLYLGAEMVSNCIDRIEGFPKDKKNRIIHLILSHHGREEYGAREEPLSKEAEFLHLLDMIDSRFKLKK